MFFADPVLALREFHRVLISEIPGVLSAWGPFDQPYWQSTMGVVHRHVGGPLFQSGGPDPFRFSSAGQSFGGISQCGFSRCRRRNKNSALDLAGNAARSVGAGASRAVPFRPCWIESRKIHGRTDRSGSAGRDFAVRRTARISTSVCRWCWHPEVSEILNLP